MPSMTLERSSSRGDLTKTKAMAGKARRRSHRRLSLFMEGLWKKFGCCPWVRVSRECLVLTNSRDRRVLLTCAHQLARGGLNGRHDVHVNTLADISFIQ